MLHPQARALLDLMDRRGVRPLHTLTPPEARAAYRDRRELAQPPTPVIGAVRDLLAPGPHGPIPLRLYSPLQAATPGRAPGVLVFFHGGGYVIGDLDTHDTLCRQLANGAGCAVLAVDYRLAPEHRFPCAVDDALAATRWCQANVAALGLDPRRVAVGGDSAGGNLAAVVALALRESDDPPLCFQLLIYPITTMHFVSDSHRRNAQGYLLTRDSLAYFHDHYIDAPAHDQDWRASPILHPDLGRLPPALVLTAGFDPLRDDGVAYAQALNLAGTAATLISFERQIHGFILMGRVLDEANTAVDMCADALRRGLSAA